MKRELLAIGARSPVFDLTLVRWLVILSMAVTLCGASAYIRDTIAGKSKPNRVSWLMWALAPAVGAGAALASGADPWAIARVVLAGVLPATVLLFSFANPQSYWKLTRFDWSCGAFSGLAMVVWLAADAPRLAILLAVAADAIASLPTLTKVWRSPYTETGFTYAANCVSVALVLPSIPVWNVENSAFQVYLLGFNALMTYCIYRRRSRRRTG